jgi:hypothetical protein
LLVNFKPGFKAKFTIIIFFHIFTQI